MLFRSAGLFRPGDIEDGPFRQAGDHDAGPTWRASEIEPRTAGVHYSRGAAHWEAGALGRYAERTEENEGTGSECCERAAKRQWAQDAPTAGVRAGPRKTWP